MTGSFKIKGSRELFRKKAKSLWQAESLEEGDWLRMNGECEDVNSSNNKEVSCLATWPGTWPIGVCHHSGPLSISCLASPRYKYGQMSMRTWGIRYIQIDRSTFSPAKVIRNAKSSLY